MNDEHFRALRQLILDQNVKIEALTMAVRALTRASERTDVIYVAEPVDISELDNAARSAPALIILPRVKLDTSDT